MICFRYLNDDNPSSRLAEAVASLCQGSSANGVFTINPSTFSKVPTAKFAYWESPMMLSAFNSYRPMESGTREARIGPSTGDDSRYVRLAFEVPSRLIGRNRRWVMLNKGGSASPYYFDYHLVIDWDEERQTFRGFCGRRGRPTARPNGFQDLHTRLGQLAISVLEHYRNNACSQPVAMAFTFEILRIR
jgi:hypothetical protein